MNATRSRPSHHRQQIWVCVIAGLFLCDFVLCGYLPSHQRLRSLQEAKAQQRCTLNMANTQGEELASLRTRLDRAQDIVKRFDTYVPPDGALGGFLQQITALMNEHDLTDQVVAPGKELGAGDLGCIPIQITCKGTLTNLFGFFEGVQTLGRLVRVQKVTLENDAGYTGQLSMHAEAVIFYQLKSLKTTQDAGKDGSASGASNGV